MSDVGEDDEKHSDWIREASDDSESETGGSCKRKYYSEYSSGGDILPSETAEPVQWTGDESDLKRQESPIISNMEDYHAGPEFEEKCNNWMTGDSGGADMGAHRSSSEIDHNENHLINVDYRGGEAFCDSDILSSDQSLSDYESNENRWSSSDSSRKNEAGHKKILQEKPTECSMPRASMPVFSRSAETARAKMDQKQSAQRPDRVYARRQLARRKSVPGEQGVGQHMSSKAESCCPIRIKCSKSCTAECEILKPGSEKNYPLPDRARFSSLYEEILRCDEFLFFTDEDYNGVDEDSDFGDDGPVSEITGLDNSDSKSESSRNRVSASRSSARTESPEGSLRDGAVPGGIDKSLSAAELDLLRFEDPLLSPILPVQRGKSQTRRAQAERKSQNSNDVNETKEPPISQSPEMSSDPTIKQEAPILIDKTLGNTPTVIENEAARANVSSRLATLYLMSSLENTSACNILGNMLENAYLQTVKVFESTENMIVTEMKGSAQQPLTVTPDHSEAQKDHSDIPDSQPNRSEEKDCVSIDECINTTCNNKSDDDGECRQEVVNEKLCSDNTSVDSTTTKLGSADNVITMTKSVGPEGGDKPAPDDSTGFEQGKNVQLSTSQEGNQVVVSGTDSSDVKPESLVPNVEEMSAVRNPITPISRQYYMPFLNILRSRKLINKRVRRPPQKFFKLLQTKSEASKISEKCSGSEIREAGLMRDLSCKMSTKIFPKGREVPPGWKPGQYSTGPLTNAAACNEMPVKRKHKKGAANKCKQHNKCYNNNKKRQVSSEASVHDVESEESLTVRNARASYSSDTNESTESKHTVGYGERYNPHSEDSSEIENKGKKTFGQEFESKRQYYESLNSTSKKTSKGGMMDKREITSQVNFLKTIDEFCTAEDMVNMEYDYNEEYNQPSDLSLDSVEYHISLAQYYSGRPSNMHILKGNPPGELMASGSSGVRIRRAKTNIPSALDAERLKSLNVEEVSKEGQSKLGMWSLNTLYAHKMSIAEVPRESNLKTFTPSGDGNEEAVDANQTVVRKAKAKHSRKRQLDRHRDYKLGKYRSVKTSHLEKLAVFESERKVTYLDLLKSGYNSKPYKNSKEINAIDTINPMKEVPTVQKSKSCDASVNKGFYSQKEISPEGEQDSSKRLKLVRFNDPKPLEEDKVAEVLDRSEEDTWCYSVNAMLLRANQALEQQKMATAENNHHFPRPESAKVVAPVVKPMSSSFLSELLEQDKVEQKIVKRTQKMRRNDAPKAGEEERQGKRNFNNNDNTEENKPKGHSFSVAFSTPNNAISSCALTNVLPNIEQMNDDGNDSTMHSAGILKIKTSTSSKKPKDKQPCRDQKVFPGDCPANVYFSSSSTQPNLPPRKLLPLRYAAPVDVANQAGANVRAMKESLLQRAANDILECKSQIHTDKHALAKATTTNVVTAPRYSRTDHRVSTIVQMFSDFNTNANATSANEEDEDNAQTSIDAVRSPYVLPPRGSNRNLTDQSNAGHAKQSCSLHHALSEFDDKNESTASIESNVNYGHKYHPDLNFTRGWNTSQIDNDERAINISNLNYDVSNDRDALGLKVVMGILGKKQESSKMAPSVFSSQSLNVSVADQSHPFRNDLNVKGPDRRAFINAAFSASKEISVPRGNDDIIECCIFERNNKQSSESCTIDRCHGLWDPNFTQENVISERLLVPIKGTQTNVPGKITEYGEDGKTVDCVALSQLENEKEELTTGDICEADTGLTSYREMPKKSESPKYFALDGKTSTPTGSCFKVLGYQCPGRKKKLLQTLTNKQLCENLPPLKSLSNTNVSDSNELWMSSEIVEKLSGSNQDKKSDYEWQKENHKGIYNKTMIESNNRQHELSQQDLQWDKLNVPPPYPDRGDDIQGDDRAVDFSRQSGYSTPSESSRQSITDTEVTSAKRLEYKSMDSAPNTQDSHTTEIIDGTEAEEATGDSTGRHGESRQDLSTASQFTELGGNDLVRASNEAAPDYPCTENITDADHELITDISGRAAKKTPIPESSQVRDRKRRPNALGKLALTVVNSSCLVYKRLSAMQSGHYALSPRYQSLNRNSLKLMRSCDLLQIVAQSEPRLCQCLLSLVRRVTFVPAFQIRSLHPPEMIPVIVRVNSCGSETMERLGTQDSTETVPVFFVKDKSSILESVFTVYRLRSGLYGVNTTDADNSMQQLPHIADSLTIGRLSLYRVGSEVDMDKTRDVYLFADEVATYDQALQRVNEIYDRARFEKDVGAYFEMTCGWVPSQISFDGRILKTSCYCFNCVMMKQAKGKREADIEYADFNQEFKMYHNYCDLCGGCIATLPALKKIKSKVDLKCSGWTVDHKGFAIPLNTKPVSKKKVLPALSLPKVMHRKRFTSRNETRDKKSLETCCKSLSLPYVDSCATLSHRPTQSASSPNMYIVHWWWKEMEQIRQAEMGSFKKGCGAGENPSEIELAEYNDEVRFKQKQRLQEIKAEMLMHRQSPASEQMETLDREWSPPFPVQEESAATQEPLPDEVNTDTFAYNEDKTSASSMNKATCENSVLQTPASAQTSNDLLTKTLDKDFSYYFRNLKSQRKASWVRNYVEPPSRTPAQPTAPNNHLKNMAPKFIYKRIPSKLPPVSKDAKFGAFTDRLSKRVKYRPSKMINVQKRKSKKKPRKSSSLSSADSESSRDSSSSSPSCSDTLDGADFFDNHRRKGWPTSIEDIFSRTLPALRKNLGNSLRQDARKMLAFPGNFMEGDDLVSSRTDRQRQLTEPDEHGDAEASRSEHSDLTSMLEYDMCDDADEMRQMWKLCFPEVNFWDRKGRSKKSRKRTAVA